MSDNFVMKSISKDGVSKYFFQNISSIEIKQSALFKILNIGNIIVYSNSGVKTSFNSIKKPQKFIKENIYILWLYHIIIN